MNEQKNCLNCEELCSEAVKFCPNCGQEFIKTETVVGFLQHFMSDYFTFDSKIIRSYGPLMFKPGFLTIEYLQGKRTKYIPPLRMYIFISILFFIVISIGSADFFGDFTKILSKLFFLLLPFFALLLRLFYRKVSTKFLVDFVFSIHFHAFLFSIILIYIGISLIFPAAVNLYILLAFVIYIIYYLWKSMYEVYGQGKFLTFIKLIAVLILYLFVLVLLSLGATYNLTL